MRIAITGGTGTLGRHIVQAVRARGDEPVVLARATGVDLTTGGGLDAALDGVDAVIDAVNLSTLSADEAARFFTTTTANLTAAAARRGVANIVVPSIVGIDRVPHGYYAGKLAHERAVQASATPWTIQRLTQFHEFAGQIFAAATIGPFHVAPRARIQPIAAADAAARLALLAGAPAAGRTRDVAGPREERLDDMVRDYARAARHRGWLPSVSVPGAQMKGMRAGLVLPGADAELVGPPFAEWLAAQPVRAVAASAPPAPAGT
ncbi:SDR family oxidoreductase [Microbacter sp. GSS18]|nr:SDR family oxidoreductase [Microbacter sp. GSS18]